MKAVRLYAKGDLRVEEVPAPPPPHDDWVKVKVARAGICGSDIHNFRTGQWITRSPSIAGHEFSGTVTVTGPHAKDLRPGDRVAADSRFWCGACAACRAGRHHLCDKLGFVGELCDGGFADEVNLPARLLHKVPDGLDLRIAATAEPVAVALHAVKRLRLRTGEPILIMGCGPIGGFAAVILKHLGLGPVHVADRNPARARLVARVTGATVDAAADIRCPAVIDATGSIAALRQSLASVAPGGALAIVGISHGTFDLDPNILVEREISLVGCHAFQDELPAAIAMLPALAGMIEALLDHEISAGEVPAAYARIAAGEAEGLKTLIRFDEV